MWQIGSLFKTATPSLTLTQQLPQLNPTIRMAAMAMIHLFCFLPGGTWGSRNKNTV